MRNTASQPFPIISRSKETINAALVETAEYLLVFDLEEGVKHHGSALVEVDRVGGQVGLLLLLRIPTINLKIPVMMSHDGL